MSRELFETAETHATPTVRQLSTFLDNRVGQLLLLTKAFEGTPVRILALSIVSSVDCAIVRLLVDKPEEGEKILQQAGFPISVAEMIVVEMPPGPTGLLTICSALLSAEVNIHYAYPLLSHPNGRPSLALLVDDLVTSAATLKAKKFRVLDESDLTKG
jgi:hypothetical protein